MRMQINWIYKGVSNINLSINITDKVAILLDESGTGKTFMFQMLASYCVINQIPFEKFDYGSENKELSWFIQSMKNASIVIMDNADLYMTPELFEYLKSCGKQVIISIKHEEAMTSYENCGFYVIDYNGDTLKTVREDYDIII